jgi:uncharacterized membrane protein YsdA (DUF1294 family)
MSLLDLGSKLCPGGAPAKACSQVRVALTVKNSFKLLHGTDRARYCNLKGSHNKQWFLHSLSIQQESDDGLAFTAGSKRNNAAVDSRGSLRQKALMSQPVPKRSSQRLRSLDEFKPPPWHQRGPVRLSLSAVITLGLVGGVTIGISFLAGGLVFLATLFVLALNAWVMLRFWQDKQRAIMQSRRIPESSLLSLALIGGTPGAYLARHLFRHKTRKQPFSSQLNLIAVVQLVMLGALICYSSVPAEILKRTMQGSTE